MLHAAYRALQLNHRAYHKYLRDGTLPTTVHSADASVVPPALLQPQRERPRRVGGSGLS
jgi:hypothetical protein